MEKDNIILDTSILIEYIRAKDKSSTSFTKIKNAYTNVSISIITEFEVLSGCDSKMLDHHLFFLKSFSIYPINRKIVHLASRINYSLIKSGKPIQFSDIFIASTAIINNLELVTHNYKHFNRIPELNLIDLNTFK